MSIKKVRVSRAIGANVGVTRAYRKSINRICNEFRSFIEKVTLNKIESI